MLAESVPGTFEYWWWHQGGQGIGQILIFFVVILPIAVFIISCVLRQFDNEEQVGIRDEFFAANPNRPCVKCDRRCEKWDCKWHVAMTKTEWAAHSLMFGIMMDQTDKLTGRNKDNKY